MEKLIGKTIAKIDYPNQLIVNDSVCSDDNIEITFTDGTVLKMASWDYEGYSSGIYKEIKSPPLQEL